MRRVLFISGPIGLGHVAREKKIADELRKLDPSVEIIWYAEDPAASCLVAMGEPKPFTRDGPMTVTSIAEKYSNSDYSCNLQEMFLEWRKTFPHRIELYQRIIEENEVELVVGDETMELMLAIAEDPKVKRFKLVIMTDFLGAYQINHNPKIMLATYLFNRGWAKFMQTPGAYEKFIWIGEEQDVRDVRMGLFLPSRKALGDRYIDYVGHILAFDPKDYADTKEIKKRLGYDVDSPLVLCTVGGSSAGRGLLDLFSKAVPSLKKMVPNATIIVVTGPNIDPSTVAPQDGMKVVGYVPRLYEHMAASDVVVTTAGGTTTLELTALQKPFLYLPLIDHFEQNCEVVPRVQRHGAGVKIDYATTTPQTLANAIKENMRKEVEYPIIPLEGAENAAKLINEVLRSA